MNSKDLLNAENRLEKTLPKLPEASSSEELRSGFEEHLGQTLEHVDRLRKILTNLGEKPAGKKCDGIRGITTTPTTAYPRRPAVSANFLWPNDSPDRALKRDSNVSSPGVFPPLRRTPSQG